MAEKINKNKGESTKLEIRKILFFKIGAIGDVLMTTPLVREARKAFPRAKITYYVGKYAAPVLEGNKNIDSIEVFDQNMFFKKNFFSIISLLNRIRDEKFDMVFVLDKHWIFGLFMKMAGIRIRIGFDRGGEGKYNTNNIVYQQAQHEIKYYLSLLDAIGVKHGSDTQMDLFLSKQDTAFADKFFAQHKLRENVIGMLIGGGGDNPGESGAIRRWPTEKYIELIHNLSKDCKIILLGGPKDRELNLDVIKFVKSPNVVNAAGSATIRQSAAIMKKCSVIVTHDSGPMHIASAVNDRIVSIFGPTNPVRKAPLHKESIALWKDEDIYEEEYEHRGKLPDPGKAGKWMRRITAKEVESAVRKML